MLKEVEKLQNSYWIDETNFGTVRRGDVIGIIEFINLIRFQFNKPDFKLYIPKGNLAEDFLPFLGEYFLLSYDNSPMKRLPYRGNIWGWYDYAYRYYDITPNIKLPSAIANYNICINPLFDATYSVDRNWKPELLQNVVKWCQENFPKMGIRVIASPTLNLPELDSSVEVTQGTLAQSIEKIMSSSVYIGGETGLTHFAFNTVGNPSHAICLRGEKVEEYTESLTIKDKPKIFSFLSVPEGQDYDFEVSTLPRGSRSKKTALFRLNEGDFTDFDKLAEVISDKSTVNFPSKSLAYEWEPYIPKGDTIIELGSGKTMEYAIAAHKSHAKLISVSSEYSQKLKKADELNLYNLYTDRVQLICEDEDWFMKNWVDTGRK